MENQLPLWGLFWGTVSAISLPLGAILGLRLRPSKKVTSSLMAFGGGALLFALTLELFGHVLHEASNGHQKIVRPGLVVVTMVAAALGGLIFQALNHVLNNQGGFLRKRALLAKHISKRKRGEAKRLLRSLGRVGSLRQLSPEDVMRIVGRAERSSMPPGKVIFEQGSHGDRLYFIEEGTVEISRRKEGADEAAIIATLGKGDVFGEISLVSDSPRTATVQAVTTVELVEILKEDYQEVIVSAPAVHRTMHDLAQVRIAALSEHESVTDEESAEWQEKALANLEPSMIAMTTEDIDEEVAEHGGGGADAAMGIWLGIALDGIPESLVIGLLVVAAAAEGSSMGLAFVAGVFLANLPEAMSSSVTMRNGGMAKGKILWMWGSLCLMTGAGAMLGTVVMPAHPSGLALYAVFAIEGLAAGAMLTMIAETMLPEAYEQGSGPIVGLSTLAGFLAAVTVKLIE